MLEQAQINAITIYCEKRGVKYYDVQLELVDHIADIIEDLQKTNPVLSFSEALELAGEQFSIDEFKYIVRSKKDHIEKNISRLIENEFLTFFYDTQDYCYYHLIFCCILCAYLDAYQ